MSDPWLAAFQISQRLLQSVRHPGYGGDDDDRVEFVLRKNLVLQREWCKSQFRRS